MCKGGDITELSGQNYLLTGDMTDRWLFWLGRRRRRRRMIKRMERNFFFFLVGWGVRYALSPTYCLLVRGW